MEVPLGGSLGMFASINILNENGTTETAHARHFSDNFRGILHVTIMQGQTLRKETKDLMLSPQTAFTRNCRKLC